MTLAPDSIPILRTSGRLRPHLARFVWAVSFLLCGVGGCALGGRLVADIQLIEQKVNTARDRGAYRCAPEQLAIAETELEFLRYELDEGDFLRAERHHRKALDQIGKALTTTDPDKCAEKRIVITQEPTMVIEVLDRDQDGINDNDDQCPEEPEDIDGVEDEDGCPEDKGPDTDGDTIEDPQDQCPQDPEDFDDFEDVDGCPDTDNDEDTVLDTDDQCPLQPGPPEAAGCPTQDRDGDGVSDDIDQCPDVPGPAPKGCPARVLVVKTNNAIVIKRKIQFETSRAGIRGGISSEILDQIASVMKSNPTIKVNIEGHSDSRGASSFNLDLSDQRAKAVGQALLDRGVAAARVMSIGYGETKPIASNRSRKGRAANRRVEFKIVQDKN
jgi:OmpA-OmpF porin, OOP family